MLNSFDFTAKGYSEEYESGTPEDRANVAAHIFSRMSVIQGQLERCAQADEQTVEEIVKSVGRITPADLAPERNDPPELRLLLSQYCRLGNIIFSPSRALSVHGISAFDPVAWFADLLKDGSRISKLGPAPKIEFAEGISRLYRDGLKVTPLLEIVVQILTAYRPNGGTKLVVECKKSTDHGPTDCELVLTCHGAKIDSGISAEKFQAIADGLIADEWKEWHMLGTRMVACIIAANQLGGHVRPLRIVRDSLDFEVLIPIGDTPP